MNYLLALQKAIAQTQPDAYFGPMAGDLYVPEYLEGWDDVVYDLNYGISLGSEHAVCSQIKYWTDPVIDAAGNCIPDNLGDKAYCDRMQKINELMKSYED